MEERWSRDRHTTRQRPYVAVLLPAYNEEVAIQNVVRDFRAALPQAEIFVYDNNSTDRTAELAAAAGAIVRRETLQGKGNVVRRMFADIDADIYVLADADDTYEAAAAPRMIKELVASKLDLITGVRVTDSRNAFRPGHRFGNWLFTNIVKSIFGDRIDDILSGYRVMSRRFVKSFPALTHGFQIETEMTIHSLELRLPMADMDTVYRERGEGSSSKLSTFRDGLKISVAILKFIKDERPILFFGSVAASLVLLAVIIAANPVLLFFQTGKFPFVGRGVLAASLVIVGGIGLVAGLILSGVSLARKETKRLIYLAQPSVGEERR